MRDEEWIVQVAPNWVSKVNNELTKITETRSTESNRWKKQSIYRIPQFVKRPRSHEPSSIGPYEPWTVSIGPYHHGKQQLESMEEYKHLAFLTFLQRSKKPLQCYVDALAPVAEDLKDAYYGLDPKWRQDTEAFLQLMIVDGCFILEMMWTTAAKSKYFSSHGKPKYLETYLKHDMLLLENQLPFTLFFTLAAEDGPVHDAFSKTSLLKVIMEFFSLPFDSNKIEEYEKCVHILDLYRRSMLMRLSWQKEKPKNRCSDCYLGSPTEAIRIPTATEMKEGGIRFKLSRTWNLNDISFKGGVLKLPRIIVDDALESLYLNMMALEQSHVDTGNEVTSFVFFMDSIIDSAKDVELLRSCGIIQNALGSDKEVANLFNSLARDATLDLDGSFDIVNVYDEGAKYCEMLWPFPRWMAYVKHHYFTNLVVGLSVVAAIFVFALTGIQTTYTVLGYYHSK